MAACFLIQIVSLPGMCLFMLFSSRSLMPNSCASEHSSSRAILRPLPAKKGRQNWSEKIIWKCSATLFPPRQYFRGNVVIMHSNSRTSRSPEAPQFVRTARRPDGSQHKLVSTFSHLVGAPVILIIGCVTTHLHARVRSVINNLFTTTFLP